jgi:hypothetical protein
VLLLVATLTNGGWRVATPESPGSHPGRHRNSPHIRSEDARPNPPGLPATASPRGGPSCCGTSDALDVDALREDMAVTLLLALDAHVYRGAFAPRDRLQVLEVF